MSDTPGSANSGTANDSPVAAKLPVELIIAISEYLSGSHSYRTLAQLNIVCRTVHEATLPVLYDTLIWDTKEEWWILDGGRVPEGWGYTKYLVLHEDNLSHLNHHLARIFPRRRNDDLNGKLKAAFPDITMLVVKSASTLKKVWHPRPRINVSINLYKPINTHTFLTVTNTHTSGRHTLFFGAPFREDQATRCVECIEKLVLEENAYITASPRPVAFLDEWEGKHYRDPDFKLIITKGDDSNPLMARERHIGKLDVGLGQLNLGRRISDHLTTRGMEMVESKPSSSNVPTAREDRIAETFKSLSQIIPRRREGSALYAFEITCSVDDFETLSTLITGHLKEHMELSVRLKEKLDRKYFQHRMTAFAENYISQWERLGPVGFDKTVVSVQYTTTVGAAQRRGDFDTGKRHMIADFKTFPARFVPRDGRNVRTFTPTQEGFELAIWKAMPEEEASDFDWYADPNAAGPDQRLFTKTYHPVERGSGLSEPL